MSYRHHDFGSENLDAQFEELWQTYPAAGRSRKPLSQQCYIAARMKASHEEIMAPLREGGAWDISEQWQKGYIMSLGDYLSQQRWIETPRPVRRLALLKTRPVADHQREARRQRWRATLRTKLQAIETRLGPVDPEDQEWLRQLEERLSA